MFKKLHVKLGDFWWYSLMLFCACRTADILNAFVGLWLVPKYVDPSELGAVMPLANFANFLALPAAIFAMTFMKEVNSLAISKEYGKMKTLIRGVFTATGIFLIVTIFASRLLMPSFMKSIRIAEGSLGFLILTSAFVGCVAPIYTNVLQALKMFKAISVINVICAPIRFLVMVVTMPLRALSGFFAGQAAAPAFNILASLFCLRKNLAVPAEPYWNTQVVKRFGGLFLGIAGYQLFPMISGLVEVTVIRRNLPEVESGAYYMVTRFSEIACFINGTFLTILFPLTAELSKKGATTKPLVIKAALATLLFGIALAVMFAACGRFCLSFLPNGQDFARYHWAIPAMIMMSTMLAILSYHTNTEVSAGRFGFLKWWIPFHIVCPLIVLFVTGFRHFDAVLPQQLVHFLSKYNFTSLKAMTIWLLTSAFIKLVISCMEFFSRKEEGEPS